MIDYKGEIVLCEQEGGYCSFAIELPEGFEECETLDTIIMQNFESVKMKYGDIGFKNKFRIRIEEISA